jgi:SAM-dependent methyltransferase
MCASEVSGNKLQLMREYLVQGRVLDLGCGNGLYGLHVESMGCNVLQIDVADRRDPRARHLPFRIMDASHLDLPEQSFDDVLAFDIMEHLDDDAAFLRGVRSVCRRRLLMSVPNAEDDQPAKLFLTHIHHKDKTHRREYTPDSLRTALEGTGFNILTIQPNFNPSLFHFAHALARASLPAKIAARLISLQCLGLECLGLFENRCVGDWFCVAE